ncbi:MAG: tetratricopeptide repeat protein [Candidatus Hodarchaeales archaeon]
MNESELYKRAKTLVDSKNYKEAIQSFDELIKLNPKHTNAWWYKGYSYANLGRRQDAIKAYEQAIALKPNDPWLWYNKGSSYDRLGQYEQAVLDYDKALSIAPSESKIWYKKGRALTELDKITEALESFNEIIKLDSNHEKAFWYKGFCLSKLRRHQEAIEAYEEALRINSDDGWLWYNKGLNLSYLGRFDEALKDYSKALAIIPNEEKIKNKIKEAEEKIQLSKTASDQIKDQPKERINDQEQIVVQEDDHIQRTFEKILRRYDDIELRKLAKMLKMDEVDLELWLIDLPEEYGFKISQNVVHFDRANIDAHIDDLMASFVEMEQTKTGKI